MQELLLLKDLITNTPQCISLYIQQGLKGCYFYQVCILQISIKGRLQHWLPPMVPHGSKAELCRTSRAGLFWLKGLNTVNTFSSLSPWSAFPQQQLSLVPGQSHQLNLQKQPQRMGVDVLGWVTQPVRAPQDTVWQGQQKGSSCWGCCWGQQWHLENNTPITTAS